MGIVKERKLQIRDRKKLKYHKKDCRLQMRIFLMWKKVWKY